MARFTFSITMLTLWTPSICVGALHAVSRADVRARLALLQMIV